MNEATQGLWIGCSSLTVRDAEGNTVADCQVGWRHRRKEHMTDIVRAVNAHDAFVNLALAALCDYTALLDTGRLADTTRLATRRIAAINAALALAKGVAP